MTTKKRTKRWRAAVGLDFGDVRVEPGDEVPADVKVAKWLVSQGKVEPIRGDD